MSWGGALAKLESHFLLSLLCFDSCSSACDKSARRLPHFRKSVAMKAGYNGDSELTRMNPKSKQVVSLDFVR
jgi:hypothetical protein